jgi:hypothetical protein
MADKCIISNPDIAGIGVSLFAIRGSVDSMLLIVMPRPLDSREFLHHDTLRYLYTREEVHGRISVWDIQELGYQRSRYPLYRRNSNHTGEVGPISRDGRDVYLVFL